MDTLEALRSISKNIRTQEDMSAHVTFRAGGKAEFFASPRTEEELLALLRFCRREKLEHFILVKGSDLLVSDKGYPGVIISTLALSDIIQRGEEELEAGAGATMSAVAAYALEKELSGFEFASGIPGTIGGAVFMNAGAYEGEMKDILQQVKVLEKDLRLHYLPAAALDFAYRYSNIEKEERVVLSAVLKLKKAKGQDILAKMQDLEFRRRDKQPLDLPSAGSTFKRPEGHFAGKLISDAGLMGYSIGDAQVSTKHAGFVVNKGSAKAAEIYALICHIQKVVKEKFGVELEREVRLLGEF